MNLLDKYFYLNQKFDNGGKSKQTSKCASHLGLHEEGKTCFNWETLSEGVKYCCKITISTRPVKILIALALLITAFTTGRGGRAV